MNAAFERQAPHMKVKSVLPSHLSPRQSSQAIANLPHSALFTQMGHQLFKAYDPVLLS